ncbi:pyocin activator PrtN family protein [Pelagibacterium lentulum]|uniref:pyocin activator PrtN family protein n=1 Tax=Pelagibacterium lentulum TaxID=2029865 RepID=UPI001FCEE5E2|nr:pyocin activator PrtN family protein [Pelagibacterium lentulum]
MPHFVPFFKVLPLGCHSTAPFCLRLTTTANPSSHSKLPKFLQELGSGEIGIPPVRIEWSQMCAKSIHLRYLASYPDKRREIALSELHAFRHAFHYRRKY